MQDFPSSDFDHGLDQHDCGEPYFGTLSIKQRRQLSFQLVHKYRRSRCICLTRIASGTGKRSLAARNMAEERWSKAWEI
tara:strand:- start:760 stop:996 length:237 start_codon:yes stop_codon:yes gene_type:complete